METLKPNRNHVTDRRSASAKRANDITQSEWPVVTLTAYRQLFSGKCEDDMDLKMRRLCLGRIRVQQMLSACDQAMHSYSPQVDPQPPEIYNALRALREQAEKLLLKYPLTLK